MRIEQRHPERSEGSLAGSILRPRHRWRGPLLRATAFLAVALALAACGTLVGSPEDDDDDAGDTPTTKPGAVAPVLFALTDAPVDDAQSVLIYVKALEVTLDGNAWTQVPLSATAEIDLLHFQDGLSTPLAAMPEMPVGTYQQTRLVLADDKDATLVDTAGVSHALKIPGGEETGLKIVTPFTVEEGKELKLTIDFDLRKSVRLTGPTGGKGNGNGNGGAQSKYMLKPTLRLVRDDGTGTVKGKSATAQTACIYAKGAAKDDTDACDGAVNAAKVKDGAYTLAFVPAGEYEVRLYPKDGAAVDAGAVTVNSGEVAELP